MLKFKDTLYSLLSCKPTVNHLAYREGPRKQSPAPPPGPPVTQIAFGLFFLNIKMLIIVNYFLVLRKLYSSIISSFKSRLWYFYLYKFSASSPVKWGESSRTLKMCDDSMTWNLWNNVTPGIYYQVVWIEYQFKTEFKPPFKSQKNRIIYIVTLTM